MVAFFAYWRFLITHCNINAKSSLRGECYEKRKISYIYLSNEELKRVVVYLINLKNKLIAEGRYTDAVDELLCKVISTKKKKIKVKYI